MKERMKKNGMTKIYFDNVTFESVNRSKRESWHDIVADDYAQHKRFGVVGQCFGDEAARRRIGDAFNIRIVGF